MNETTREVIRRQIHRLGWDLHRYAPEEDPGFQLVKCLHQVRADLIFDVGANIGQFASGLRKWGFKGRIVSFEPLSDAHRELIRAADQDANWQVHPRCALGANDGQIEINISGNSVSSSILPMLRAHESAARQSAYVGTETVPISKLDTIAGRYISAGPEGNYVIKIDTQGYEWDVLDGAPATLRGASGVLCELSLVPLYAGQRLWRDIINRLEDHGFALWTIQKAFTDPETGRFLQLDALFLKEQDIRLG